MTRGSVGALVSGGKDSTFAIGLCHPDLLVCAIPEREDSWMFHTPNLEVIDIFAECVGLPLVKIHVSGEREREVEELVSGLEKLELEKLVSGVVASRYQKQRIDSVCAKLGIEHVSPLWGRDQEELLREEVREMEVVITSVSAEGLGREWLGRKLDTRTVEELIAVARKFGINPAGEGGEYETLVLSAPFFRRGIRILEERVEWEGSRGVLRVKAGFR